MTLYRVTEGERELFVVAPDIDTAWIRTAHEWGYPEDGAETSAEIEVIGTVTEIEAALVAYRSKS